MNDTFINKLNSAYHSYVNSTEQKHLNARLIDNEKWFRKLQDNTRVQTTDGGKPKIPPLRGGYLFNAIITKHADAMDNYPDITVLPREERDKDLADMLTGVIPYILERNNFEKVYSDNWYSKLKTSSCYGVTWDESLCDGKGDIKIAKVDLLNLFWQPNINDIEESDFVFYHYFISKKNYISLYGVEKLDGVEFIHTVDTYEMAKYDLKEDFVLIIDAYYKIKKNKKTFVHTAKFSGVQLLFSSEDEKNDDGSKAYPDGYYKHGRYPFVMDVMYPAEQDISGFGVADVVKDVQSYIDSIDELLQYNNRIVGKPRYLVSDSLAVDINDLADLNKEFIPVSGSIHDLAFKKLDVESLPAQIIKSLEIKREELKEIIGNRDFQQGGTSSGVTSGHALSLLQSMGDKLSRDIIKSSYRSYKDIVLIIIELIRQFYNEERTIRITGKDGEDNFVKFSNKGMNGRSFNNRLANNGDSYSVTPVGDLGSMDNAPFGVGSDNNDYLFEEDDIPLFDVKLCVQKSNPYSRELNNQTILQLAGLGLLNPQAFPINLPVLNALQFEGKSELIKELSRIHDEMTAAQPSAPGDNNIAGAGPAEVIPGDSSGDELIDVTELINRM